VGSAVTALDENLREQLIDAARQVGKLAAPYADQIERDQKLPPVVVQAMAESRLLKMTVPRSLGGCEVDPETFVRVVEEISRWDGSVGWCVLIPGALGLGAGSLQREPAWEIFGRDPHAYVVGSFVPAQGDPNRPPDRATVVDGGYRVSGRWAYASGCMQATWLVGASPIYENDVRRLGPNGIAETRWVFFAGGRLPDPRQLAGDRPAGHR
jgi:alkylation response protein AidB-like acyl-CoA dehydrogenase